MGDALPDMVVNSAIKKLFSAEHEVAKEALINDLMSIEPTSLKLLTSIYQYGNPALKERAIGRYQSSTSVNILVGSSYSMVELHKYSEERDKGIVEYFTHGKGWLFKTLDLRRCPVALADEMRVNSLERELITSSMPQAHHQVRMVQWEDVPAGLTSRTIRVTVAGTIRRYLSDRGPYKAYLGSDTKIKQAKGPLETINPDTMERSALSTAQMGTCIGDDPNLQEFLDRIITEKTNSPVATVKDAAAEVIGGSLEHRGEVMTIARGAHINYDLNIMAHITINTDNATAVARKQADYTIMF